MKFSKEIIRKLFFSSCVLFMSFLLGSYQPKATETSLMRDFSQPSQNDQKPIRLIIELKDPPICKMYENATALQKSTGSQRLQQLQIQQSDFLNKLHSTISYHGAIYPVNVLRNYYWSINGLAVETDSTLIPVIQRIENVSKVSIDHTFTVDDIDANRIIGANTVWNTYGMTGKGVKIGIIDTGIDYRHPDLGGGIGPGFKVIAGYDLVDNDTDPLDDLGHGTEVAGLIAGNGAEWRGVAPEASLICYLVQKQSCAASEINILAAIDLAFDLDQDPDTFDPIDILNMSLSTTYNAPDHILTSAVDNAFRMGVLVVTSAGNRPPGYFMIGAPGNALHALSVGATDFLDKIWNNSAYGPSPQTFFIKPDMVAPGVDITSQTLNNTYITGSGTSYAAPLVSGAAALLKQTHPEWSALYLKAALMENAKILDVSIFAQGSGRLDLTRTFKSQTLAFPPSLSMGLIDHSLPIWKMDTTLQVHNYALAEQTITVRHRSSLSGVTFKFQPEVFRLSPGQTQNILVGITIDNRSVAFADSNSKSHSGYIELMSADTLHIPYSFVKYPHLNLNYSGSLNIAYVYKNGKHVYSFLPLGSNTALLEAGIYDIVAWFDFLSDAEDAFVVKENINILEQSDLVVNQGQANQLIVMNMYDPNNPSLNGAYGYSRLFLTKVKGGTPFTVNVTTNDRNMIAKSNTNNLSRSNNMHDGFKYAIRFSEISNNFIFDFQYATNPAAERYYLFQKSLSFPVISQTYQLTPDEMKHLAVTYRFQNQPITLNLWNGMGNEEISGAGNIDQNKLLPYIQDWYLDILPYRSFPAYTYPINLFMLYEGSMGRFLSKTPSLIALNKDTLLIKPTTENYSTFTYTGNSVIFGLGPEHWFGKFENLDNSIRLRTDVERGLKYTDDCTQLFAYQFQDMAPSEYTFVLSNDQGKLLSGSLSGYQIYGGSLGFIYHIPVDKAGQYSLSIISNNYFNDGTAGTAQVKTFFNTSKNDKNPPTLNYFGILCNGEFTDKVDPHLGGKLKFGLDDESGISDVKILLSPFNQNNWQELSFANNNTHFEALIPNDIVTGFYDLRIVAEDIEGNKMEYQASPAFSTGKVPITTNLDFYTSVLNFGSISSYEAKIKCLKFKNLQSAPLLIHSVKSDDISHFKFSKDGKIFSDSLANLGIGGQTIDSLWIKFVPENSLEKIYDSQICFRFSNDHFSNLSVWGSATATGTVLTERNLSGTLTKTGSPYYVQQDVYIPPKSYVKIEPGVMLIFKPDCHLYAKGEFKACGTEGDSIYFIPENKALCWGGIVFDYNFIFDGYNNPQHLLEHCVIRGSKSRGISGLSGYGTVTLSHCSIYDNQDGGIQIGEFNTIIKNCTIYNNSSRWGAGILLRGQYWEPQYSIINSAIFNNSNPMRENQCTNCGGGGILASGLLDLSVINTIIVNNWSNQGGGIKVEGPGTDIKIENSIIWSNNANPSGGSEFYLCASDNYSIDLKFSDIDKRNSEWLVIEPSQQYHPNINWRDGNISSEPLFVAPEVFDFSIRSGSPCIDGGNPDPAYYDRANLLYTDQPLAPAKGSLRNDIGMWGGPNLGSLTSVQKNVVKNLPSKYILEQNYPNPFNAQTTIKIHVPQRSVISLAVYDILGREVQRWEDKEYTPGIHIINWDGSNTAFPTASGLYFLKMSSQNFAAVKKIVLIR